MARARTQSEQRQQDRGVEAWKQMAVVLSCLIYVCFVGYSEFHFWLLISRFVPGEYQIIGVFAVAVSTLTAVALPAALHFWFRTGMQRNVGLVFYGIHFLIVAFNLVLNSNLIAAGNAPAFITDIYGVYLLPSYLILYAIGWTVLWFNDDSSQALDRVRELVAAEREGQVNRRLKVVEAKDEAIEKAFESVAAKQAINRWAAKNAPKLLAAELGMSPEEMGVDKDADFKFWMPKDEKPTTNGQQPPRLPGAAVPPRPVGPAQTRRFSPRPRVRRPTGDPSAASGQAQRPANPPTNQPTNQQTNEQRDIDKELDDLLQRAGFTREKVRELIQKYGLDTAEKAYEALKWFGKVPEGMTVDRFRPLYERLMRPEPAADPNHRPTPAAPAA